MKRFLLFGFALMVFISAGTAQVSINTNNNPPDPSAGLDVNFINKGFLPPRMTYTQMMSIPLPVEGLIIYNTTIQSLCWFNGTTWVAACQNFQYVDSARVAGLATNVRYNGYTHMQVFDTPGTYFWSLTTGECNVMVEVWGGGGGATITDNEWGLNYMPGAGGGYGKSIWHFSAGTNITITVGSGGVGSIVGPGADGETSSFGNLIYATGGQGGDLNSVTYFRNGGTSNGTINISGQSVNYKSNAGGAAPNGGHGGSFFDFGGGTGSMDGMNGVAPGGGGGGGNDSSIGIFAGNGGTGRVVIYW